MRKIACVIVFAVAASGGSGLRAQHVLRGQNVVPVFEGWERNVDGTFNFVFGYFNRNLEEEFYIPVGPDNFIDFKVDGDAGQPTHFYSRRQKYIFKVTVPKDWGRKDVVWALRANGKTEKAYGSLLPEEVIDEQVYSMNRSGGGAPDKPNQPPTLKVLLPDRLTATVGVPLELSVQVSDDGIPPSRPAPQSRPPGRNNALGLRTTWWHYRGPGTVTFDPWLSIGYDDHVPGFKLPQIPSDGRVVTKAIFDEPGVYTLRAIADDGYLYTAHDVRVTVAGKAPQGAGR
jgi:hypothetical protein